MPRREIQFDELDKKFFEELPLLVDVFVSSMNKISNFLYSFHQDLLLFVEEEINKHEGWMISNKETFARRNMPFTNEWNKKYISEGDLHSRFDSFNSIKLIKGNDKDFSNYFYLYIGLEFNPQGSENVKPAIYFTINKWELEKYGGELNSKGFYEVFKNDNFKIGIDHKKESEEFSISIIEFNTEQMMNAYQYYKEFLTKFFTNIKW